MLQSSSSSGRAALPAGSNACARQLRLGCCCAQQPWRRRERRSSSSSVACGSSLLPSQQLAQLLQRAPEPPQQQPTQPQQPTPSQHGLHARRRSLVVLPAAGALCLGLWGLLQPQPAAASALGPAADKAWEALGGGPADLTFPEAWLGVWDVTSTLVSVELPMGEAAVPPLALAAVRRAEAQDLRKPLQYQVAFMTNPSGQVIYDRRFNTAALLATYYGSGVDFAGRISWNPQDPNALNLELPEVSVRTRVMRRSEEATGDDRFETSEFMQQVFDMGDPARPRVKASQCFTKYKFRDEAAAEAAGGPAIVATQVVSDYLTPYDDEQAYLRAANRPVATYTYKMAFTRHHDAGHVASAVHTS